MTDDHTARIARLDAMIERAKRLPSIPEMAARVEQLTQTSTMLTVRVEALEQECEALRHRALLRLWGEETYDDDPR
jgi:hypothetical protein